MARRSVLHDEADLRSDCGEPLLAGTAAACGGLSFMTAQMCRMDAEALHAALHSGICVDEGGERDASASEFVVADCGPAMKEASKIWDRVGPDEHVVYIRGDYAHGTPAAPVFLTACHLVLGACLLHRPLTVVIPSTELGRPGTTLSLRRLLRNLARCEGFHETMRPVDVGTLFRHLHRFLGGILFAPP